MEGHLNGLDRLGVRRMTAWDAVARSVLQLGRHDRLHVEVGLVPHPLDAGFYRSTGLNRAPLAHYRLPLRDGRGLHVHAYAFHYEIHWDRWDPSRHFVRHMIGDVAHALKRTAASIAGRSCIGKPRVWVAEPSDPGGAPPGDNARYA